MGLTARIANVWNRGVKDHRFTTMDVATLVGCNHERKNIASVLCKFVRKGAAVRGYEKGLYIKVLDVEVR